MQVVVFEHSGHVGGLWNYSDQTEEDSLGLNPDRQRVHSSWYVHRWWNNGWFSSPSSTTQVHGAYSKGAACMSSASMVAANLSLEDCPACQSPTHVKHAKLPTDANA